MRLTKKMFQSDAVLMMHGKHIWGISNGYWLMRWKLVEKPPASTPEGLMQWLNRKTPLRIKKPSFGKSLLTIHPAAVKVTRNDKIAVPNGVSLTIAKDKIAWFQSEDGKLVGAFALEHLPKDFKEGWWVKDKPMVSDNEDFVVMPRYIPGEVLRKLRGVRRPKRKGKS